FLRKRFKTCQHLLDERVNLYRSSLQLSLGLVDTVNVNQIGNEVLEFLCVPFYTCQLVCTLRRQIFLFLQFLHRGKNKRKRCFKFVGYIREKPALCFGSGPYLFIHLHNLLLLGKYLLVLFFKMLIFLPVAFDNDNRNPPEYHRQYQACYYDIQCSLLVSVYFILFDDQLLPFVYIRLLFLYFVRLQHHESCVILINDNRSQDIIPFIGFAVQNSHCSANSLRATSRIEHGSE